MIVLIYSACFFLLGCAIAELILRRLVVASAERIIRAHAPSGH